MQLVEHKNKQFQLSLAIWGTNKTIEAINNVLVGTRWSDVAAMSAIANICRSQTSATICCAQNAGVLLVSDNLAQDDPAHPISLTQ